MDYETFTRTAAERAGLPVDTVERVEHATLRTLADRISGGEAQDLASQLPSRLQDDLRPAREEAEAFGVDEFVRRVAQRGDVGPEEARTGAAAVHRLLHTEPKVLHEVPDTSGTDLGPVYELAPRT